MSENQSSSSPNEGNKDAHKNKTSKKEGPTLFGEASWEDFSNLKRRWNILFIILIIAIIILGGILFFLYILSDQVNDIVKPPEAEVTYFAENQVVVTGDITNVITVTQIVAEALDIQLTRVDNIDEDKIPDYLRSTQVQNFTVSGKADDLQRPLFQNNIAGEESNIFLYRIVDTKPTPTSLETIVLRVRSEGEKYTVTSDRNYVIGSAPLEIEGDPACTEGATITESTTLPPGEVKEMFYNQWAFSNTHGINLFSSASISGTRPQTTFSDTIRGDGVIVALFDTSPFDLRGERLLGTSPEDDIDFGNDIVNHFEVITYPDIRDHGVYGASLIHAIAPNADIRFYRVLDQSNRGDLFTLLRALESLRTTWETANKPLVINLSLGVHPPKDDVEEEELVTLANVLSDFYKDGAVIVAASGNDSSKSSVPLEMQIPATYSTVIGVGASNYLNEFSCFSNNADIKAPGGDNGEVDGKQCMPVVSSCINDPSKCLVGYVYTPQNAHYAYWLGSSFSAPMVSGAAALMLDDDFVSADNINSVTNVDVYRELAPHLLKQQNGITTETVGDPKVLDLANIFQQ